MRFPIARSFRPNNSKTRNENQSTDSLSFESLEARQFLAVDIVANAMTGNYEPGIFDTSSSSAQPVLSICKAHNHNANPQGKKTDSTSSDSQRCSDTITLSNFDLLLDSSGHLTFSGASVQEPATRGPTNVVTESSFVTGSSTLSGNLLFRNESETTETEHKVTSVYQTPDFRKSNKSHLDTTINQRSIAPTMSLAMPNSLDSNALTTPLNVEMSGHQYFAEFRSDTLDSGQLASSLSDRTGLLDHYQSISLIRSDYARSEQLFGEQNPGQQIQTLNPGSLITADSLSPSNYALDSGVPSTPGSAFVFTNESSHIPFNTADAWNAARYHARTNPVSLSVDLTSTSTLAANVAHRPIVPIAYAVDSSDVNSVRLLVESENSIRKYFRMHHNPDRTILIPPQQPAQSTALPTDQQIALSGADEPPAAIATFYSNGTSLLVISLLVVGYWLHSEQ